MSVQKDKRNEGKLTLPVTARNLALYTIQITKNPKVFNPEFNYEVTSGLVREAKDIFRYIWTANNVLVTDRESLEERKKYQRQAALLCNVLLADIAIAQKLFHLKGKRVRFWTEQVVEVRNKTRAWIKSDANRYQKYL